MNTDAVTIMNRLLARETHSLLQYMRDVWPWSAAGEHQVWKELKRMIAEEQRVTRSVAGYLMRRKEPLANGRFPADFTSIHFLAVDHLLPKLAAYERVAIAELESDLAQLTCEEARGIAQTVLKMKRRHLEELEHLAAEHSGAKAVSTKR